MSHVTTIVKAGFNKIFKNLAKEFNTEVTNVRIFLCYKDGNHFFRASKDFKEWKDVKIMDYAGLIPVGGALIEPTIAQSGARYSKELNVPIDSIKILLRHREEKLPSAILYKDNDVAKKENGDIREIDIDNEFLK